MIPQKFPALESKAPNDIASLQQKTGGAMARIALFLGAFLAVWSLASAVQAATPIWSQGEDFVRLENADSPKGGTINGTLPPLSADAVRAVLSAVKVGAADGSAAEFLSEGQINALADPISRGLRSAMPGQDVTFAIHVSTSSSLASIFGPPRMSAGRIWVDGDAIGLIIGMVQETYLANAVTLDRTLIRTGSRLGAQQTAYHILPGGAVSLALAGRQDWARISPVAWTGTFGMPLPAAPQMAAPVATLGTPPAEQPASPALLSTPAPQDPLQIEQRFASLKRLLDAHMITEGEYQHAKEELLKAMSQLPKK